MREIDRQIRAASGVVRSLDQSAVVKRELSQEALNLPEDLRSNTHAPVCAGNCAVDFK